MVVDVLYEGLTLQAGAQAREESDGAFIELEAPMPVGTRLTVRGPDGEKHARVEHVVEGQGAGVRVRFVDGNGNGNGGSSGEPDAGDDEKGKKKKKKGKKGH